ncbi:L,D-transpeptidase [Horticoccus luteus]|uniref:L,D-transpeptidase n=1 Tax=Horticoccus luteus TaxID=2862869 RepID=A0A8F9TU65_9BACT|nr:L,D-transpeptidase [Horticoccus luteus]QYM77642.1 L,D-transpeptidase [Horticoccus luteus]
MEFSLERVTKAHERLGIKPTDRFLLVRIGAATLQFFRGGELVKAHPVSTSKRPPSNLKGSLGTPRGLHEIAERIGAGQPPGMVFKSRVPTGRHFAELPDATADSNLITTRILWLRGLEPGINRGGKVDTYDRYVYIHGTNHEARIGEPLSAGCVLMRSLDLIELFDAVRVGDHVLIVD